MSVSVQYDTPQQLLLSFFCHSTLSPGHKALFRSCSTVLFYRSRLNSFNCLLCHFLFCHIMGFLLSDKGSSYKKHLGKFSPIERQKEHERYKNKRSIFI